MKNIVGVRFKRLGKIYFFNPEGLKVKKGDFVIVETVQGEEYGEVIIPNRIIEDEKLFTLDCAPLEKTRACLSPFRLFPDMRAMLVCRKCRRSLRGKS